MKEKKYYCLLLNGCFDTEYHYVSLDMHSVIKNVLRKKYTDLSTLEDDFMELDDKITINEDHWLVEGSFPVIAEEIDGKVKIAKVNVDENQDLAIQYGIMSIPTLLAFKGGNLVEQSVGLISKSEIMEIINKL